MRITEICIEIPVKRPVILAVSDSGSIFLEPALKNENLHPSQNRLLYRMTRVRGARGEILSMR